MQSLRGSIGLLRRHAINSLKILEFERDVRPLGAEIGRSNGFFCQTPLNLTFRSSPLASTKPGSGTNSSIYSASLLSINRHPSPFHKTISVHNLSSRCINTGSSSDSPAPHTPVCNDSPRVKFKRLDKTSRYIMQILNKEAVEEVRAQREIPDIQPGHIIQLKVEVPENKRRVSTLKGIVIARRNAGINTTFRLRRLVAGVGIESLFMLYSPNIKEIKVLDKKKVRRAKLYYLRDRMNPLKK